MVAGLDYDPKSRKVAGVRVIDQNTRVGKRYTARIVFLNASTLASTQILLNSTSESFPNGIGNRSGVLGHYLMDHPHLTVSGVIPGMLDKYTIRQSTGRRVDAALSQRRGAEGAVPARLQL